MKRLFVQILIIVLAFSFASCSENEISNSSSVPAVPENSGEATQSAVPQSYEDVLSKDDTYLMTVEIEGKKHYICINEKISNDESFKKSNAVKYDFAVLTDLKQTIKPTLVKKGDTFMNWKITEVSAYFTCLDDGRMYPTSNITIKMEGNWASEASFNYNYYDASDREIMFVYPEIKDFELFPYPVYTYPIYSPSLINESNFKYEFEVINVGEIVEKNNLKHGNYKGNIKVKGFNINYDQPGGTHYYSATIESSNISEKLKGKYFEEGTESGYEFIDNKVISYVDGKVTSENNTYTIEGNKLTITFIEDGVLVESLDFTLSEDRSYFTGKDHEGTHTFVKQN